MKDDFYARSRFVRSTIPEEKWGTTRSRGASRRFAAVRDETILQQYERPHELNYII